MSRFHLDAGPDPHRTQPSRRRVLAGLGAAAAAAAFGGKSVWGQSSAANPRRIDVHHHIVPPPYAPYIKASGFWSGTMAAWSPSWAIERMDKDGIETGVCSLTNDGYPTGEELRKLARDCNEYAAKISSTYPRRFGSFAYLPLPITGIPSVGDIVASLKELEYALDTLKADGVQMWTNYGDVWVGDPIFNPIYEELNRRKAVIYTHPRAANCCGDGRLRMAVAEGTVEWESDTGRAVANLIFAGTAARYPDMPVIFSHGGGTMRALIRRFVNRGNNADMKDKVPGGFLAIVRKYYFDTAQQTMRAQLWPLKDIVTPAQIVFGTDAPGGLTQEYPRQLRESGIFTDAELRGIDRDNALRILPRFRT